MVNTRHIDKNGLSFECPEYYDIGKYPNSDEAHKSMVALSKKDRKCELYITVYRRSKFDVNAKRNMGLLERYLRLQNYKNVSANKKLPYCFNATVSHHMGNIKTTIAYNFDHDDVIMIVGNIMPSSSYDCIEDIRIILDTLHYDNNIIKRVKRKVTSKNKTIIGLIAIVLNFAAAYFFKYYYDVFTAVFGSLPAICLVIPWEKIKSNKFLSIVTFAITMLLLVSFILYCPMIQFALFQPDSYFYFEDVFQQSSVLVILLINVFCALLLYVPTGTENKKDMPNFCPECGNPLKSNMKYCNKCGSKIEQNYDDSLKYELLYLYDENYGYRLSKTKLVSLLVFITSGFITSIAFWNDPTAGGDLLGAILAFIVFGLIVAFPAFVLGHILRYLLKTDCSNVKYKSIKYYLFCCNDETTEQIRISKTKLISWFVFGLTVIFFTFIVITTNENDILTNIFSVIFIGLLFSVPTFILGSVIRFILKRKNS